MILIASSGFLFYIPDQEINMTQLDSPTFGQAIRAARKAQGLRQDQLAGAAGVGVRFIVDLEAGKPSAQLGKALHVAATLGLVVSLGGAAT
jgi:HTH-type transcriptional regulator / antitoxin HipB